MNVNEQLELLNEALNELDVLLAKSDQRGLIYSFIDCDERFAEFIKGFYLRHYSEKDVPEGEEVTTTLYELVVNEKMTQGQVAELFDQFIAAALFTTPGWFGSQPAGNFEETICRIPQFYKAMCYALRIMNRMDQKEHDDVN